MFYTARFAHEGLRGEQQYLDKDLFRGTIKATLYRGVVGLFIRSIT